MAETALLKASKRPEGGGEGPNTLRRAGKIPAVIYGKKQEPLSLSLIQKDLEQLFARSIGENILVEVDVEGEGKKAAMIQDVQHHPVDGRILHIDLHAVSMDENVQAVVPLEANGEAVGVKTSGGILEQVIRELEVECLPANLPGSIPVDVSELDLGQALHVREISLPEGVVATVDPELIVFSVVAPKVVEEPTAEEAVEAAEEAPQEPEAIKEKPATEESKESSSEQ